MKITHYLVAPALAFALITSSFDAEAQRRGKRSVSRKPTNSVRKPRTSKPSKPRTSKPSKPGAKPENQEVKITSQDVGRTKNKGKRLKREVNGRVKKVERDAKSYSSDSSVGQNVQDCYDEVTSMSQAVNAQLQSCIDDVNANADDIQSVSEWGQAGDCGSWSYDCAIDYALGLCRAEAESAIAEVIEKFNSCQRLSDGSSKVCDALRDGLAKIKNDRDNAKAEMQKWTSEYNKQKKKY